MDARDVCSIVLIGSAVIAVGCGDGRSVGVPDVNGATIAAKALELHDANSDGLLEKDELTPGLEAAMKLLDTDESGSISGDELAARVDAWKASNAGMIPVRCAFTYRNKPLVGAEIQLTPEEYLGDTILPAKGKTNRFGWATLAIPAELRPGNEQRAGIQFGIYRVSVSLIEDGKETMPKRYNEQTEVGLEISMDSPGIQSGLVQIELE